MKMRKRMTVILTALLTAAMLCGNASILYASDQSMSDMPEDEIILSEEENAPEEDLSEEDVFDVQEDGSVGGTVREDGVIVLPEIGYDNTDKEEKTEETQSSSTTTGNNETEDDTVTPEIDTSIDISSAVATTKYKSYTYNGYYRKPAVTVVYNKTKTLVKDRDYTVTYKNNKNVGTATFIVTGKGEYSGSVSGTYKITAMSISGATVKTKSASYKVTGSYRKPIPIVTLSGRTLVHGTDFKLSYKNNKNVGTATVTATGIGNYTGTAKGTFRLISDAVETVPVYRLYNHGTGEHFYTISTAERSSYIKAGWKLEGIAWYAPKKSNTPIYRVSNPNGGNEHHYTKSKSEKDWLVGLGWNDEGIGWYSDDNRTVPVYRHYQPVQRTGNHHYTVSKVESDFIVKNAGWKYEGISWYAAKLP